MGIDVYSSGCGWMKAEELYWIGWDMNYLRLAGTGLWMVKKGDDVYVLEVLKRLRSYLERNVLSPATIQGLDNWILKLGEYEDGKNLRLEDAVQLTVVCGIWADRVEAELGNLPVLRLDKSVSLNFDTLQGGARGFFEDVVWNELSEMTRSDLDEAARCLLCGIPTASVMVALRGAENVLRDYYRRKTKKEVEQKGWKGIIDELLAKDKSGKLKYGVNESLIGHLDFVRMNRNMAEHPDKVFGKRSAENLFSQVVITITEMCEDLA